MTKEEYKIMKAKVIATQEIIEIIMVDYNYALNEKVFLDVNKRHKRYFAHELEFVDEPEVEKKVLKRQ